MRAKAAWVPVWALLLGMFLYVEPIQCAELGKGGKPSTGVSLPAAGEKGKAVPTHGAPSIAGKAAGSKGPLPDLAVREIKLDPDCRVVLVVQNVGKGAVADEEFARGQIRVVAGGRQVQIPFAKADPRGALKAPGGLVRVDSGLVLEKKGPVMARLLGCPGRALTRMLSPKVDAKGSGGLTRLSSQGAGADAAVDAAPPAPVKSGGSGGSEAAGAVAKSSRKAIGGAKHDYKLHVDCIHPASWGHLGWVRQGGALQLSIYVDKARKIPFDGNYRVTLTPNPGTSPGGGVDSTPDEGRPTWIAHHLLRIPDVLPSGSYRLEVRVKTIEPGMPLTWSRDIDVGGSALYPPFSVARIDLLIESPAAGEVVRPIEETVFLLWHCNYGREPGPETPELAFRFTLLKGERLLHRQVTNYSGRSGFGTTPFSTTGCETGSDYEIQIALFNPGTGETYKTASTGLFAIQQPPGR